MNGHADRRTSEQTIGTAYRARVAARRTGDHPDEATWEAFASGMLESDARGRVADHVVSCGSCREIYEVVCVLMDEAHVIDRGAPTAPAMAGTTFWQQYGPSLATAATAVLTVGAATFYYWGGPGKAVSPATLPLASVTAPALPSSAPAVPAYRLALIKPDLQLPADLVVPTRDASKAGTEAFLTRFGEAIVPYREGRFDDAVRSLEDLAERHGDIAEVWFYLGVSHLFAGRPAQALLAFDRPGVAASIGDDLAWQRAVALERLGRLAESNAAVRTLCAHAGPYQARACATSYADGLTAPRN